MDRQQLTIERYDASYIKVHCSDDGLAQELSDVFTFKAPGYRFHPKFKAGWWDGNIKLYNVSTRLIYHGLSHKIEKFCEDNDVECINNLPKLPVATDILSFVDSLNLPDELFDHQRDALKAVSKSPRHLFISPTGSGKSLIIYIIAMYTVLVMDQKVLIVDPTVALLHQLYVNFQDYGLEDIDEVAYRVYTGQDKNAEHPVIISTWQSIYKQPPKYFDKFGCVIGDEAHLFTASSLVDIMKKLNKCEYRYGFTGTIADAKSHEFVLQGLFGSIVNVATTAELQDKKILAKIKVNCVILKHGKPECAAVKKEDYQVESDVIVDCVERNEFIIKLATTLKGNTLVLYRLVDRHGVPLYKAIKDVSKLPVHFVSGTVDGEEREEIRQTIMGGDESITVASYGTFSTGIDVPNINNVVFASPYKSKIKVLQSIGRGLRRKKDGSSLTLYDIADDMRSGKYINHTYRHMQSRLELYVRELFDYNIHNITLGK